MFSPRIGSIVLAALATAAFPPGECRSQATGSLGSKPRELAPAQGNKLLTRVYSIADFGDDPQLGPWIAESATEIIQPSTWKANGGSGVIRYSDSSRIFAVSNSDSVHSELEAFLQNIKRALPVAKDVNLTQAQLTIPQLQPIQGPTLTGPPGNYAVPAPLKQPKHLFHFIIRYEGDGVVDSNVVEFLKNSTRSNSAAADSPASRENAPATRPSPASTPAPAPALSSKAGPEKIFTKNSTFHLPIQMDERVRPTLREVQLHVKKGDGDWVRQEVVAPQTDRFTFRAPLDGEYSFALVTVDHSGHASPSNLASAPPLLRIVVDTSPPVIEDATIQSEGEQQILSVKISDVHLDKESIRAVVLTEQGKRALSPLPDEAYRFHLLSSDLRFPIRITAADMSGNQSTLEFRHGNSRPGSEDLLSATPSAARKLELIKVAPERELQKTCHP